MRRDLCLSSVAIRRTFLAHGMTMMFFVFSPFFIACSSTTINLSSRLGYDEFNKTANNKNAEVVLITKEEIQATDVMAKDGFLYWTDRKAGRERSIVFDSVDRVYVGNRAWGATKGFAIGLLTPVVFLAGLAAGTWIGILGGNFSGARIANVTTETAETALLVGGVAGGVIGYAVEGKHIRLSNSEKTHSIAVYCRDGRVVTGILTQLVPNEHIIIRDSKGEIEKFEWGEISKYEETGVAKP